MCWQFLSAVLSFSHVYASGCPRDCNFLFYFNANVKDLLVLFLRNK